MREIKFRVWDKKAHAYLGNSYFLTDQGVLFIHDASGLVNVAEQSVVEQLTGLKDKNGKEIYEGDIVKYHNIYREGHPVEVVGIKDMELAMAVGRHWTSESEVEVIGNIHENPELLEKKS